MLASTKSIAFGDYLLDFGRGDLRRAGEPVSIQPIPLRLLLHVAENRDRVVSRAELLEVVWPGLAVGEDAVSSALAEARRTVGDDGSAQRVIRTLKGRGLRFVADVQQPEALAPRSARSGSQLVHAARLAVVAGSILAAGVWWNARTAESAAAPDSMRIEFQPLQAIGEAARVAAHALHAEIARALVSGPPRVQVVAMPSATQPARATHRLHGIVQGEGDLRLVLMLSEASSGTQVWSQAFEFERGGGGSTAFAGVASRVAAAIARVWQAETLVLSARSQEEAALARRLVNAIARADHAAALTLAERITTMNPQNWAAHVYATWVAIEEPANGGRSIPEVLPIAESHARDALRFAPAWCGEGLGAMARVRTAQWRWEEAEQLAREGCARDPESSTCSALVRILLATGRSAEAVVVQRRRVDALRTTDPRFWLAIALAQNRQFLEAKAECEQVNLALNGRAAACVYVDWELGQRERAADALIRSYRANGLLSRAEALATTRAAGGPEAVWRQTAFEPTAEDTLNAYFALRAIFAAQLGERESALDLLEQSLEAREGALGIALGSPYLDLVSGEPRFRAIVDRAGLAPFLGALPRRDRWVDLQLLPRSFEWGTESASDGASP